MSISSLVPVTDRSATSSKISRNRQPSTVCGTPVSNGLIPPPNSDMPASSANVCFWADCVAKLESCSGKNFSRKQEAGDDHRFRIPSVAVPKSPVSLTREDQSPHVFTRKTRLQPAEFLITCAKRLLQHNRANSGSRADTARRRSLDPLATSASSCNDSCCRVQHRRRAAAQEGLIGISIRLGAPDEMAASRAGAISAARSILWAGRPIEAASARKSMAGSRMSMPMKRLARVDA